LDGRWIVRFSTRSQWDAVQRAVQRKKFYATLKHKLDQAEQEWHRSQPKATLPPIRLDDLHIRAPWYEQDSDQTD